MYNLRIVVKIKGKSMLKTSWKERKAVHTCPHFEFHKKHELYFQHDINRLSTYECENLEFLLRTYFFLYDFNGIYKVLILF